MLAGEITYLTLWSEFNKCAQTFASALEAVYEETATDEQVDLVAKTMLLDDNLNNLRAKRQELDQCLADLTSYVSQTEWQYYQKQWLNHQEKWNNLIELLEKLQKKV